MPEWMTIGQVAREAGVGVQTLRYYEREGLLEEPARRDSGYRMYQRPAIQRVRWIRRAKMLGFSLNEIRDLLLLRENPQSTRGDIRARTKEKIDDLNQKIAEMTQIRDELCALVQACDGGDAPLDGCPILGALEGEDISPCASKSAQNDPPQTPHQIKRCGHHNGEKR